MKKIGRDKRRHLIDVLAVLEHKAIHAQVARSLGLPPPRWTTYPFPESA